MPGLMRKFLDQSVWLSGASVLPRDLINDRSRDTNTALLFVGLLSRDTDPVLSLAATSREYVMREVGPNWQKMGPNCHIT